MYRVPIATYRIQFNAGFTFDDARKIVAYLRDLGITDLYASPLLRARKGSTHGYDVVDASALNPELGTSDDFTRLHEELAGNEMGLLLDIVPNHMAASQENAWWMSVLENGPLSRYLHYFDIDWRDDKVLLPILGRPYGEALESGEIQLAFDADGFFFMYYDKRLPLAPQSYQLVLRECLAALPNEGAALEVHDLVQNEGVIDNSRFLKDTLWRVREQSAAFRDAIDDVVARFNAISICSIACSMRSGIGSRTGASRARPSTTDASSTSRISSACASRIRRCSTATIASSIELIADGKVTGAAHRSHRRPVRSGELPDQVAIASGRSGRSGVSCTSWSRRSSKRGEALPSSLRCAGTTGYDFLDTANARSSIPGLEQLDAISIGVHRQRRVVRNDRVRAQEAGHRAALLRRDACAWRTPRTLAVADRNARDFAPSELAGALVEVTACMPVYRTYVREAPSSDEDRARILTMRCARRGAREWRRRAALRLHRARAAARAAALHQRRP
jgi:(1->4)-alpha-D-glucan 1-alpha-D-glucosylmutase